MKCFLFLYPLLWAGGSPAPTCGVLGVFGGGVLCWVDLYPVLSLAHVSPLQPDGAYLSDVLDVGPSALHLFVVVDLDVAVFSLEPCLHLGAFFDGLVHDLLDRLPHLGSDPLGVVEVDVALVLGDARSDDLEGA